MTGVNYRNVQIYYKGLRMPDCFYNVTFTQHSNSTCKWYRVNIIEKDGRYVSIGDYRLDKIERIVGVLK